MVLVLALDLIRVKVLIRAMVIIRAPAHIPVRELIVEVEPVLAMKRMLV